MRLAAIIMSAGLLLAGSAVAQVPPPQIATDVTTKLATGRPGGYSAADLRTIFMELVASAYLSADPSTGNLKYWNGTGYQPVPYPLTSSLAPSATTDTTNASNITSGTLPAGRLPSPTGTTLGGVQSATAGAHQFGTGISTAGVPTFAQPAFGDIGGTATPNQLPAATTNAQGAVKPDGSSILVNNGAISVPTATGTTLGLVKPDGASILTSAGIISVPSATTITPGIAAFGTGAGTAAQGNDGRFPASVTGLRKGAGVGSNDVPAVAGTDYLAGGGAAPDLIGGTSLKTICPGIVTGNMEVAACLQAFFNAAAAVGANPYIFVPAGNYTYASQVVVTVTFQMHGVGKASAFKSAQPAGSVALGFIDAKPSAARSIVADISIDGQQTVRNFVGGTGNTALASLVLLEGDYSQLINLTGTNAYDNCYAFGALDGNGNPIAASPRGASFHNLSTSACGMGSYAGAGLDVLSGSFSYGDGLTDVGSYGTFIVDTGAGAQGNFSNISSIQSLYSQAHSGGGHNYAIYIGGGPTTLNNVQIILAGDRGIWFDYGVQSAQVTNLSVKQAAGTPIYVKGLNVTLVAPQIDSPGYGAQAWSSTTAYQTGNVVTYGGSFWTAAQASTNQTPAAGAYWTATKNAAIIYDSSYQPLTGEKLIDPQFNKNFVTADVGVQEVGGQQVTGSIYGGNFSGVTTPTLNLNSTMTLYAPNGSLTNGPATLSDGGLSTYPAGMVSESNAQIADFGINDSRLGTQTTAAQGGFLRFSGVGGQYLWTLYGRAPNAATVSGIEQGDYLGNHYAKSYNILGGGNGYTGTKTAGSCVLAISGGIITGVSGC